MAHIGTKRADHTLSRYVFVSERLAPLSVADYQRMVRARRRGGSVPVDLFAGSRRLRLKDDPSPCVLYDGIVIGRIFSSPGAPADREWMWASGHNGELRRAA